MVLGTLNVLSAISLLFIAAIGLAVIFGVMGVVNLAHGEFIMMGAYASYLVTKMGYPVALAFIAAPVAVGLFALLLEPIFFRHIYGKVMESILATWGLSIALRQVFLLAFGSGYKSVPYPTDAAVNLLGTTFSLYRMLIMALAVLVWAGIMLVEHLTNLGAVARAVMNNAPLASALGVNTKPRLRRHARLRRSARRACRSRHGAPYQRIPVHGAQLPHQFVFRSPRRRARLDPGELLVRARRRGDNERMFPSAKVTEDTKTD